MVARHGPALTRAAVNDMVWADAMAREVLRLRGPAEGLFRCAARRCVPWCLCSLHSFPLCPCVRRRWPARLCAIQCERFFQRSTAQCFTRSDDVSR